MSKVAVFKIDRDKEELQCPLDEEVVFGRSELAHVKVDDLRCNGIHALLERGNTKREFYLVDLGSEFGTYVDGEKINETTLHLGSEFVIGQAHFRVRKSSAAELKLIKEEVRPITLDPKYQMDERFKDRQRVLLTEKNLLQVKLYWGTQALDVRTFKPGAELTLGTDESDTFSVVFKDKSLSHLKVAKYKKGQLHLKIPTEASGLVWLGNDIFNVDALRLKQDYVDEQGFLRVNLRVGDRANIQFGELVLRFGFVDPPEAIPLKPLSRVEKPMIRIFVFSLLFFLLVGAILSLFDADVKEKTLKDIPQSLKKVIYDAGIQSALKKRKAAIGQIVKTLQGGRARSEEGQSKARKAPEPKKSVKPVKRVVKTKTKMKNVAPKLDLDSVFTMATPTEKVSRVSVKGPSRSGNTASALAKGNFARGNKGLGAGGGGQSVGIGELKGLNTGGGMGSQDYGRLPSKGSEIAVPEQEDILILGGLDPDVIAAIIRRYLAQIQYCYEQQLIVNPKLRGKVTVSFIIGAKGNVAKASIFESSLRNAKVEKCMIQKIKKWEFPKPKGGGTVGVKYPFLLMSNSGNGG